MFGRVFATTLVFSAAVAGLIALVPGHADAGDRTLSADPVEIHGRLVVAQNPIRMRPDWSEAQVVIANVGSESIEIDDLYLTGNPGFTIPDDLILEPHPIGGQQEADCRGESGTGFALWYDPSSDDGAECTLHVETSSPTSPSFTVPIVWDTTGDYTPEDMWSWSPVDQEPRVILHPNPIRLEPLAPGAFVDVELCLGEMGAFDADPLLTGLEALGDDFTVVSLRDYWDNDLPLPPAQEPAIELFATLRYEPLAPAEQPGEVVVRYLDPWGLEQVLHVPIVFDPGPEYDPGDDDDDDGDDDDGDDDWGDDDGEGDDDGGETPLALCGVGEPEGTPTCVSIFASLILLAALRSVRFRS